MAVNARTLKVLRDDPNPHHFLFFFYSSVFEDSFNMACKCPASELSANVFHQAFAVLVDANENVVKDRQGWFGEDNLRTPEYMNERIDELLQDYKEANKMFPGAFDVSEAEV